LFAPFLDDLWNRDPYLVCADFADYAACQEEVGRQYRDRERWTRMSILNVARMGYFSSDRAVAEYCRDIWKVQRVSLTSD
jgi:starch phosphorylase